MEACALAFETSARHWCRLAEQANQEGRDAAEAIAMNYRQPKPLQLTCPIIALALDAARRLADDPLRQAYGVGVQRLVEIFAGDVNPGSRHRIESQFANMVGAALLAAAAPAQSSCDLGV